MSPVKPDNLVVSLRPLFRRQPNWKWEQLNHCPTMPEEAMHCRDQGVPFPWTFMEQVQPILAFGLLHLPTNVNLACQCPDLALDAEDHPDHADDAAERRERCLVAVADGCERLRGARSTGATRARRSRRRARAARSGTPQRRAG